MLEVKLFSWTNEGGQVWDFGTIKQGDSPEFTFTFINDGSEPMIISNAKVAVDVQFQAGLKSQSHQKEQEK